MSEYAHPEVLISTDWVSQHSGDAGVTIVEVNVDTELYDQGHLPGSVGWSWKTQLADQVRRDILSKGDIEALLSQSGIAPDSTVVLYGDSNNWFAAWAFWQLKIYGHEDVRLMDGGRKKWEAEGREMTSEVRAVAPTGYQAGEADVTLRAFLPEVQSQVSDSAVELVDVRSPAEFSGEILAPRDSPRRVSAGGTSPVRRTFRGAWRSTMRTVRSSHGTSSPPSYGNRGITGQQPIITYCRIGERSSHSWFVLKYLLGYDDIKNYDGS